MPLCIRQKHKLWPDARCQLELIRSPAFKFSHYLHNMLKPTVLIVKAQAFNCDESAVVLKCYIFQKISSKMKSLKEVAKMAVLKLGLGGEESIPVSVRKELELMEKKIVEKMTGRGYHPYDGSLDFDVSWTGGCWRLVLRRRTENKSIELSTEIRVDRTVSMEPEWCELFGLGNTPARFYGFRIKNFQMDPEVNTLTFTGDFGYPQADYESNPVWIEFSFSPILLCVRTKAVKWDPMAGSGSFTKVCHTDIHTAWGFYQGYKEV